MCDFMAIESAPITCTINFWKWNVSTFSWYKNYGRARRGPLRGAWPFSGPYYVFRLHCTTSMSDFNFSKTHEICDRHLDISLSLQVSRVFWSFFTDVLRFLVVHKLSKVPQSSQTSRLRFLILHRLVRCLILYKFPEVSQYSQTLQDSSILTEFPYIFHSSQSSLGFSFLKAFLRFLTLHKLPELSQSSQTLWGF